MTGLPPDPAAPAPAGPAPAGPPPAGPPPAASAPRSGSAPGVPSDRDLRVSDAERQHVVRLLERATGRGLIDLDEFTARVDVALAARTRGELNTVLVDLPGLVHPDRPTVIPPSRAAAMRSAAPPRPAPQGDRTLLRANLGSVTRTGPWEVPSRLAVQAVCGSADLDFSEAELPPVVDLAIEVTAGSVELRVPAGARIEHDALHVVLGDYSDNKREKKGRGRGPDGDAATVFVLSGAVRAGSVEVRGPRRARWWNHR